MVIKAELALQKGNSNGLCRVGVNMMKHNREFLHRFGCLKQQLQYYLLVSFVHVEMFERLIF